MRSATCRSCGSACIWGVTKNGKPMPVDLKPDPNGNLVLIDDGDPRGAPLARYATTADRELPHYTSHFATCPNAAQHRGPRT